MIRSRGGAAWPAKWCRLGATAGWWPRRSWPWPKPGAARRRAGGFPPRVRAAAQDLAGYRERWHAERTFAWLGTFRRVLVRYERQAAVYLALVTVAAIIVSLRRLIPGSP